MSLHANGVEVDVHTELRELHDEDLRINRRVTNLDAHTREGLLHLDEMLKEFTGEVVRAGEAARETKERVKQVEGAVLQIAQALESQAKESKRRHDAVMRMLKREQATKRPVGRKGK